MICMDSGRWVQGSKSGSIRRDVRVTGKSSRPLSLLAWVVTNRFWQADYSRTLWDALSIIARYRITGICEIRKVLRNPERNIRPI